MATVCPVAQNTKRDQIRATPLTLRSRPSHFQALERKDSSFMGKRPLSGGNKGIYELSKSKLNHSSRIRVSAWEKEE